MRLATALVALALTTGTAAAQDWLRHDLANGASAGVPLALFEPEPSRGMVGDVYADASGEVTLEVFAWANPDGSSLKTFARTIREELSADRETTYERVGKTFFVQSGYMRGAEEETIFYDRTERSPDNRSLATIRLTYPATRRADVDPLIRAIGNRLKRPR